MDEVTHSTETALQQPVFMRSVLADLRSQLERSRQLTQSFDDGEAHGKWIRNSNRIVGGCSNKTFPITYCS